MTDITVNRRRVATKLGTNATLADLVMAVTSQEEDTVVTDMSLNGTNVNLVQGDQIFDSTINGFTSIELTVRASREVALDALAGCGEHIEIIINKTRQVTEFYAQNRPVDANEVFGGLVEIVDLFVQLVATANRTLNRATKSKKITELEIHLLGILKGILEAKEKNDIIMLCDLLEYELVDNLNRWKNEGVPEILKAHAA